MRVILGSALSSMSTWKDSTAVERMELLMTQLRAQYPASEKKKQQNSLGAIHEYVSGNRIGNDYEGVDIRMHPRCGNAMFFKNTSHHKMQKFSKIILFMYLSA